MKPSEFRRLTIREVILLIRADDDREKWQWQRTATLATYVRNYGGPRGQGFRMKRPQDLFPHLFGRTIKDFEKRYEEAIAKEEEYMKQVNEAKARRESRENGSSG